MFGEIMDSNEMLKLYDEVKDDLKFISSSGVRAKILINLTSGNTKLKDLKDDLDMESSTILHAMKRLEERDIIFKQDDNYFLSPAGTIFGLKLLDVMKTISTIKKNKNLWLNHEIGDIPEHLILRMGDLNESILIESELADIFKPLENYSQILMESEKIRGLSPIFNPDFIETFKLLLDSGKEVELILTPQIITEMMGIMDPASLMELGQLVSREELKLWTVDQNFKVAFTVTDKFISLGLFSTSGEYDNTKDLVSDHPDAVKWGNSLFEYYRDQAKKFRF